MSDGTGLVEVLPGLDGFRVLEVTEGSDELVITIETTIGASAASANVRPLSMLHASGAIRRTPRPRRSVRARSLA